MKRPAYSAWRDWQAASGPEALVAAAVLAANPHNSQAWTFRTEANAIDLYAVLSRSTGALDPFGRERYVGLGCALENLLLAAPDALSALAERGTRLLWADDTAHVGRLLVDAARAVTQDEDQSRDSYRLFRSSDADIQRHKDGLTVDVMGMPALTTRLAKLLPATSRRRADAFGSRPPRRPRRAPRLPTGSSRSPIAPPRASSRTAGTCCPRSASASLATRTVSARARAGRPRTCCANPSAGRCRACSPAPGRARSPLPPPERA